MAPQLWRSLSARVTEPVTGDAVGEGHAGERLAVERVAHRADEGLQLVVGDAERPQPDRLEVVAILAEGALDDGIAACGHQVQRAAHQPRLDEVAALPQRLLDGVAGQVVDARPQRELGRRQQLRVQPAQPIGDVEQGRRGCPLVEVLLVEAPRQYPCGSRDGPQRWSDPRCKSSV